MEILFIIILVSVCGCGISCYYLGHRVGIESAVGYLADEGIIDLETE